MVAGSSCFRSGLHLQVWNKISKSLDKAMEDGTLSLDEALDIVEDVQEVVEEVKEVLAEVLLTELKKLKKADLQALAEKHELDTAGTKAEIIDRLKAIITINQVLKKARNDTGSVTFHSSVYERPWFHAQPLL